MNERQALAKMVAPGTRRPGKYRQGVIQIHVTRSCDKACFNCTQGSNLAGPPRFITPEQFETACQSLAGYWGVVGVFGGNPCLHPQFESLCDILSKYFPREQRGLWANNPMGKGEVCRRTFDPAVSNINVHLDRAAYAEWKRTWPECNPVGLTTDSRHSPPFVALRDVLRKECGRCSGSGTIQSPRGEPSQGREDVPCPDCDRTGRVYDEERAWSMIADCDINKGWSAMVGVFRGEVRGWFCEIAGAQAILHQDEPDYPDTGLRVDRTYDDGQKQWWELPMHSFAAQVRKHCHECGIPLRGYGELAMAPDGAGVEQTSAAHAAAYRPKRKGRRVEVVTDLVQLGMGRIQNMTRYLANAGK